MRTVLACASLLLLSAGCVRVQKLVINTNPPGAMVTMVKKGRVESRAGVPGVGHLAVSDSFVDPPIELGTSPLVYEFQQVEDTGFVHVPGVFNADQRKVCTQVVVRATFREHYAEQEVVVRNDVADVSLVLTERRVPVGPAGPRYPGDTQ